MVLLFGGVGVGLFFNLTNIKKFDLLKGQIWCFTYVKGLFLCFSPPLIVKYDLAHLTVFSNNTSYPILLHFLKVTFLDFLFVYLIVWFIYFAQLWKPWNDLVSLVSMVTPRPKMIEKFNFWFYEKLFTSYAMFNVINCYVNVRFFNLAESYYLTQRSKVDLDFDKIVRCFSSQSMQEKFLIDWDLKSRLLRARRQH